MKTEKLFELLTLVKGVTSRKWETVRQLVDVIAKGSVTIKEKEWYDRFKQEHPEYYPLDLGEIKTWSTYSTCIELFFSNDTTEDNGHANNQLVCKVRIYEGDAYNEERKRLRFEALLWLPTSFIHNIEQCIEWEFENYLESAYEKYLEAQKLHWIDNLKHTIIKS